MARPLAIVHGVLFLLLAGTAFAVLPDRATNRPIQVLDNGYQSSNVCRSCHPGEYGTWDASYHRRMTQVATPDTAVAPFRGETVELYGETFQLDATDGKLRVLHGFERDGQSQVEEKEIVLSTGSHHFQAYWTATGQARKVALFPLAYHIAEQRWIPFDTIIMAPPTPTYRQATAEGGEWNKRCVRCHATGYKSRALEPGNMQTEVAEFGIACEACHGPGEEHVAANGDPVRRYSLHLGEDGDPTIVQPERLDHRRASQVCGQCHSTREVFRGAALEEWVEKGPAYRPGDDLHATQNVIHKDFEGPHPDLYGDTHTRFWPDGEARVNGREYNSLIRSGCFLRGELSCLSCHQLHQQPDDTRPVLEWANDQLKPGLDGSRACIGCHPQFSAPAAITAHTHHDATSSGSDCLNCHMPYAAWGLQKATRSHEIDSPSVEESLDYGRPNACNQCHLDKTLAWTATRMEQWYGRPRPEGLPSDGIAAGVRWLVSGDAGQRGLMAWSMGWEPAKRASGGQWMVPYLALALADPYPVNRYAALRSLRTHPGYAGFEFDYTGDQDALNDAIGRAIETFALGGRAVGFAGTDRLLIGASGGLQQERYKALLDARNHREMYLLE